MTLTASSTHKNERWLGRDDYGNETLFANVTVMDGRNAQGRILAQWRGGAYIDLTFTDGVLGTTAYRPTEVINVWDDYAGKSRIDYTPDALYDRVVEWVDEWSEEDDSGYWFQNYLDNR